MPTATNHPTLYAGTSTLELDALDLRKSFVRIRVYTGERWEWIHSPTRYNRYFEQRRAEEGWEEESPKLILGEQQAALHFLQTKTITAKKIVESKRDPDLVTVAVDQSAEAACRHHGEAAWQNQRDALCLRSGPGCPPLSSSQTGGEETMAVGQTGQRRAQ